MEYITGKGNYESVLQQNKVIIPSEMAEYLNILKNPVPSKYHATITKDIAPFLSLYSPEYFAINEKTVKRLAKSGGISEKIHEFEVSKNTITLDSEAIRLSGIKEQVTFIIFPAYIELWDSDNLKKESYVHRNILSDETIEFNH